MKNWKTLNTKLIINNIKKIIKTGNIEHLNSQTYNFLYLTSGFIAHYNLLGFRDYYSNVNSLIDDLKCSTDIKYPDYWLEEFFQKQENMADYYKSKTATYRELAELLKNY